jgi:hypothetical protein
MTVDELIATLQALPEEQRRLPVFVVHWEDDKHEATTVTHVADALDWRLLDPEHVFII